jgi:hypothetical protein
VRACIALRVRFLRPLVEKVCVVFLSELICAFISSSLAGVNFWLVQACSRRVGRSHLEISKAARTSLVVPSAMSRCVLLVLGHDDVNARSHVYLGEDLFVDLPLLVFDA